ncbi:hypothetical protein, partial [Lactobacillus delbrueckii]
MKMKIWWFANFYWFSLLIYLNVFMFNFHYADGSSINPFVVTFLLLAICIMVGEFQFAWYMWLAKKTYKPRKRKKTQNDSTVWLYDMTPEIRTLISGVIFMTKYTKEIKLAIYHEWV